jgi:hypothetical protein
MAPSLSGLITVPKTRCFQTQILPVGSLKSVKWKDYVDYIIDREEQQNKALQWEE